MTERILRQDFAAVVAKLRDALQDDLGATLTNVSPASQLHASSPLPPAAWVLTDGTFSTAPADGATPATVGQALSEVERCADIIVDHEQRTLTACVDILVDAEDRAEVTERAAVTWPWSRDYPAGALYRLLRDYALYRGGFRDARQRLRQLEPVGNADAAHVLQWVQERLAVRPLQPGETLEGPHYVCIYNALPEAVQRVRTLYARMTEVAKGAAQQHLIEQIAPRAAELEQSTTAPDDVAEAVRRSVALFRTERLTQPPATTARAAEEQLLKLARAFLSHVVRVGNRGSALALELKKKPTEVWLIGPSGREIYLLVLARALLVDDVAPMLERLRKSPPALTYAVHEDVVRIHSRAHTLEDRRGQRALVFDEGEPIVLTPSMPLETMDRVVGLVVDGARMLGSVTAHRVLRWEVSSGYDRAMRGVSDARSLVVDGGWDALAEALKLRSGKMTDELRAIVHAQAFCSITLADGSRGNMLALREREATGRQRARIEIVLGTMLLPHYIYEYPGHVAGRVLRENKRLVPIVDMPPLIGRPNEHGAQATASMLVMRELRAHAKELAETGAVVIRLERWAELFREAHLPASLIGKVLDRWTQDGNDGPAFLRREPGDAFTLGETHARARAFLLDAGKLELDSSKAGQASAAKRRAKRAPKPPKSK